MGMEARICGICNSSTINEPFDVNDKWYVVCDNCYNIISGVIEQISDNKSKQSGK